MQPSRLRLLRNAVLLLAVAPAQARAHASEQGLVLLLPTDIYTGAGVAAVAATVVLMALLPPGAMHRLFRPVPLIRWRPGAAHHATSCLSALVLLALVGAGLAGPRDPLANPLPLTVWTFFWIGLFTAQGVLGNIWSWLNPWTGPVYLIRRAIAPPARRRRFGVWPGLVTFLLFAGFLLADPAPSDPGRLAVTTALYWLAHLALGVVLGPRWIRFGEGLTLALTAISRVGLFARRGGRLHLGLPGWQIARAAPPGLALISIFLLATGSFDGVNETFWWLGLLQINPFEYPGRSALIPQTLTGLYAASLALLAVFALCLWLGLRLSGAVQARTRALARFAPTLLPIALGYHVAHYLPTALVDGQYLIVALSDPFLTGADLLNLGPFYVTTGFFNTTGTVRLIYLTQAGAVVVGHILAVLTAHSVALRLLPTRRAATLNQLPLAMFMIAYTLFGLWLLASPRL